MPRNPDELGRGEARKHDIAGNRAKARVGIKFGGLEVRAGVIPEDAGPEHVVRSRKQRGTVHLPRKPDAPHRAQTVLRKRTQHRLGRADPVGGRLLRPAFGRARDGQRRACLGQHALRIVDQQALEARSAKVEPEIHHRARSGILPRMIIPRMSSSVTSFTSTVPTSWPFFITDARSQSFITL